MAYVCVKQTRIYIFYHGNLELYLTEWNGAIQLMWQNSKCKPNNSRHEGIDTDVAGLYSKVSMAFYCPKFATDPICKSIWLINWRLNLALNDARVCTSVIYIYLHIYKYTARYRAAILSHFNGYFTFGMV